MSLNILTMKLARTIKPVNVGDIVYRRGTECTIYKEHNFRKDYLWILVHSKETSDKYLMMVHKYDINE